MSLSLHLVSALVFFVLLYILRRIIRERDFLRELITAQRSGRSMCICPLAFVQNFAMLCKIELQVPRPVHLAPALINVQVFLDFYRQHGIQSMLICPRAEGLYRLRIKTDMLQQDGSKLHFPPEVFGKVLDVEVEN